MSAVPHSSPPRSLIPFASPLPPAFPFLSATHIGRRNRAPVAPPVLGNEGVHPSDSSFSSPQMCFAVCRRMAQWSGQLRERRVVCSASVGTSAVAGGGREGAPDEVSEGEEVASRSPRTGEVVAPLAPFYDTADGRSPGVTVVTPCVGWREGDTHGLPRVSGWHDY